MDRTYIANQAKEMKTKEDLLALLNYVKKSLMDEWPNEYKFYSFKMSHINYYCNPNHSKLYRHFNIKKKNGGQRVISAPRSKNFKYILICLNEILKSIYTPSEYAMGFTIGKSIVNNAKVHKGQNYVLNIDLKDFFPSIPQARVWGRLKTKPIGFSKEIANIIAGLCAMKDPTKPEDYKENDGFFLPQGAPTSPILTNMICDRLDRRLAGLAKRFGLRYTRYADDITFSSMHNVYNENGTFFQELIRIIEEQGFRINEKKTRLQKKSARQEVTGITVNNKLNAPRKYVGSIKNILHIWEKYGYNEAYSRFLKKYKAEKGHVKKGTPNMENVLDGKLQFLRMVKGEDDPVYIKLYSRFMKLNNSLKDISKTTETGVTYIDKDTIANFEKKFDTTVIFKNIKDGSEQAKSHRYAHFTFGSKSRNPLGKSIKAYIKNDVPDEIEKDNLSISKCKDDNGKEFWLIHLDEYSPLKYSSGVDVDKLSQDLDQLLNEIQDGRK